MDALRFDEHSTTQEGITEFVNDYMAVVGEYIDAKIAVANAEFNMEEWFTMALASGAIEGRNDNERQGNARMLRIDLYDDVEQSKIRELQAWAKREQYRIYDKAVGRILMIRGFDAAEPDGSDE